jgi:hypothetical protein
MKNIEQAAWLEARRQEFEESAAATRQEQQEAIADFLSRDLTDTREVKGWETVCPNCRHIFIVPDELQALLATAEPSGEPSFSRVTCSRCGMEFGVSVTKDD